MTKPLHFKLSKRVIEISDFQILMVVEAKEKDGHQVITAATKKKMAKLFDENGKWRFHNSLIYSRCCQGKAGHSR